MKILLRGRYSALAGNLACEGDEPMVDGGADADLVISPFFDDYTNGEIKAIGGEFVVPTLVVDAMGYQRTEEPRLCTVFRWFDGSWRRQVLAGFGLKMLANDDLGVPAEMGMACRVVHSPRLAGLFENPDLEQMLAGWRHCGFVSFELGRDLGVRSVQTGVGCFGFFNALEAVRGRISQWLTGETPDLFETWTANVVLARYPYPYQVEAERVFIGADPQALKHLWLFDARSHRRSLFSDATLLGTATAWSSTLNEACRRAARTLFNLELAGKFFRTDLARMAGAAWGELEALLGARGLEEEPDKADNATADQTGRENGQAENEIAHQP